MSNLAPFFSPLLIAVLFLNNGDYSSILSEETEVGSPPHWITCTWAQGRKSLWHHSSANPLLSEKIFRYIYQKINVQINIYVIELMTYYLTIKQGHGSHCDFSSCNYFIIHMYARMWAIFAPIILLLYLASFHLWRLKDIQVKRQQINSINI